MSKEDFMRRAIAIARDGMEGNAGGPFGAVIVRDGRASWPRAAIA